MIIVILIGVPMWWKTTAVYRVSLPSKDIACLSENPIRITVKVGIFTFDEQRSELLVDTLNRIFVSDGIWHLRFESIPMFGKAASAKTPFALENMILKEYAVNVGDFLFIEWHQLEEAILLTSESCAFIRNDTSPSLILTVINSVVLQTESINHILNTDTRSSNMNGAPQTEYDIIVSLIHSRPDLIDVKWNAAVAVETYIERFLRTIPHISNFTLKTQWNYQLELEAELKDSSLPHIITAIEKNLAVGITEKSVINLVVYIPPCSLYPARIGNDHEANSRTNIESFISLKWGAIVIPKFSEMCNQTVPRSHEYFLNTNDIMQIMLHQLQRLLDISIEVNIENVKVVTADSIAPRRWEYESYIRRNTIMYIATASNTLQSLMKLLDNISYIVINDAVGADINNAFENIGKAKQALETDNLIKASQFARTAFTASEQAFFDVSLLAQLYFPDEQKYAIYIPLFLPIMVPVVTSLAMVRKLLLKVLAKK